MTDPNAIYEGIFEYADYTGPVRETCDVVVVGSGPTGALSAYKLAKAGHDVILLEAGPVRRPDQFTLDGAKTLAEVCYEGGLRGMRGKSVMPTMQARVLGGGSHINSAICVRTPQFCFDDWKQNYGVDSVDRATLDPFYDEIEAYLGVQPTEEHALGRKNLLFKQGCDALGISSEPTPRNVRGCCGCAECFTGCPTRAKQSMDISYIPDAIKQGLRVYTSVQVREILHENGHARGVAGTTTHPTTRQPDQPVRIDAKRVILAAGCVATPVLLQKSGVPDPDNLIGANLQAHPGCAFMGVFPDEVRPWEGATQGYHSLHFLERGFKLEVLWAPPAVLAVRFPDFGDRLKNYFSLMRHGAFWDGFFALKHSRGRVKARRGKSMNPDIKYGVHRDDMPMVKDGLATLAELFFAAGATKILPGLYGLPSELTPNDGVNIIRNADIKPTDIVLASTHLFSTTRMGPDPAISVVDERGELHRLKNCFIVDTGVMPRSPAVNPMLTGMALANKMMTELAAQL